MINANIIDVGPDVDRTPSEHVQSVLAALSQGTRFKNTVELIGCITSSIGQIVESFAVGCEFVFLAFHNSDIVFVRTDNQLYHRIVWYANELDTAEKIEIVID
jgi:hypothetical protein